MRPVRIEPFEIFNHVDRLHKFVQASTTNPHTGSPYPEAPPKEVIEAGFQLALNFLLNQHSIANNLELLANAAESLALKAKA